MNEIFLGPPPRPRFLNIFIPYPQKFHISFDVLIGSIFCLEIYKEGVLSGRIFDIHFLYERFMEFGFRKFIGTKNY